MSPHDHDDHHGSELSEAQLRVRALETILTEKGYVDPAVLDLIVEHYETKTGPHVGARVVAKAWVDPGFKAALLADVKALHPAYAVELDGQGVSTGFAPAAKYRTNSDGSISR